MISLRRATIQDVDLYMELEKSVATHLYVGTTDSKEVEDNLENNVVYFIEDEGRVVGSVEYEFVSADHAHLWGLVVLPEFQGKGIGKEALKKVLEELEGISLVDLVTHPENTRAIALYESLGFRIAERKENYFGDGQPRLVLEKKK